MGMNRNSVAQLISRARINLRDALRGAALGAIIPNSPQCERAMPLIASLEGSSTEALAAAAAVDGAAGHSYLDGVVAFVAAGSAAAAVGDVDAAQDWLGRAVDQAEATQDVVATALSLAAYEHVLGRNHPNGPPRLDALGVGWRSVVDSLPPLIHVG